MLEESLLAVVESLEMAHITQRVSKAFGWISSDSNDSHNMRGSCFLSVVCRANVVDISRGNVN